MKKIVPNVENGIAEWNHPLNWFRWVSEQLVNKGLANKSKHFYWLNFFYQLICAEYWIYQSGPAKCPHRPLSDVEIYWILTDKRGDDKRLRIIKFGIPLFTPAPCGRRTINKYRRLLSVPDHKGREYLYKKWVDKKILPRKG